MSWISILILLLVIGITYIALVLAGVLPETQNKWIEEDRLSTAINFDKKFEKLLKNVTTEERKLYEKIWKKIFYYDTKKWKIDTIDNDIYGVNINNIYFKILKGKKYWAHYANGTPVGKGIPTTECTGIDIYNITLTPNSDRQELFNLFVNKIIWQLENMYYEEQEETRKVVSKEFQELVKKANQLVD